MSVPGMGFQWLQPALQGQHSAWKETRTLVLVLHQLKCLLSPHHQHLCDDTNSLSSLKVSYWGCHWKLGNALLLVRQLINGEDAAWGHKRWGCLSMLAGQALWGPAPSASEMQPKQLGSRNRRASRLWNLQWMFEKPNHIKPRKREKEEIQLWPIIEKTGIALTQQKWQWNQRCGLLGLSSLATKQTKLQFSKSWPIY